VAIIAQLSVVKDSF